MALAQETLLGRKLHICPRPQLHGCSSTRIRQSPPRLFQQPPCMQSSISMHQVFGVPPAATQPNKLFTQSHRDVPSSSPTHPCHFRCWEPEAVLRHTWHCRKDAAHLRHASATAVQEFARVVASKRVASAKATVWESEILQEGAN